MRVLITGASGFIGSNLVAYHLDKGDEVYGMDDLSAGKIQNIEAFKSHQQFKFEVADLLNWKHLDQAVQWADRIYHMAAVVGIKHVLAEPIKVTETNIIGTYLLFRAMNNHHSKATIVIASSSSVYGIRKKHISTERDSLSIEPPSFHSISTYAISKLADEAFAYAYQKNLSALVIRLFNVIGPRQTGRYGMVVPRFVQQACQNDPITVFGNGLQTRSFCDVRDTMGMIDALLANKTTTGGVYNVGRNVEIPIIELAKLVKKRAKSKSKIVFVPYKEAYGVEFNDIKQRVPDLDKCLSITNYKYHWTLAQTIDDLILRFKKTI